MSWMEKLSQTYDNCADVIGVYVEKQPVLPPIAHTIIKAHITVTLDGQGELIGAEVSDDPETIAPCTEDSDSRAGTNPPPHPLFDKLEYLAGDYNLYVDAKDKKENPYTKYIEQLSKWVASDESHPHVEAIHAYLQKGTLMADLIAQRIFALDEQGMVLSKWPGNKEDMPPMYAIKNLDPLKAAVRFSMYEGGALESNVWRNDEIQQRYIRYAMRDKNHRLCYIAGEEKPEITKHPKKIVNTVANAKLISGNDSNGFTYRGRFLEGFQVASVSFEASHKAHNALRWLIERQAFRNGEQTILAFGTGGEKVPLPTSDYDDLVGAVEQAVTGSERLERAGVDVASLYAKNVNAALLGLRYRLEHKTPVVVMALDCATTGRLSITYYRELLAGEYLERVAHWHKTCAWLHTYKKDAKKTLRFVGAPASKDIATAAYGQRADARMIGATVKRLLPCILDGAKIPVDLVLAAVRRASNPVAMEYWEWNKTLSIACALYRKQNETEGYTVALEENRTDRSYLFGRLLAVADEIERWALRKAGSQPRETNAMRYMNALSQRPVKTWMIIEKNIKPYQARLGLQAKKYNDLLTRITSMFAPDDFLPAADKALDGLYLLGYHCQRQAFFDEAAARRNEETNGGENNDSYE